MTDRKKQEQFQLAMQRFETVSLYKGIEKTVSILNVTLQAVLLYLVLPLRVGWGWQIVALAASYALADLINGYVHLVMDHNESYECAAGPLIAKFHLHHETPRYRDRNLLSIYFYESGSKVWLVFYLALTLLLSPARHHHPVLFTIATYVGILSSVAEVSHYLCHNSQSRLALLLMRMGILLSREGHAIHHRQDNTNYCFLNGMTNPIVNWIAHRWFSGYKSHTDLHHALYAASAKST